MFLVKKMSLLEFSNYVNQYSIVKIEECNSCTHVSYHYSTKEELIGQIIYNKETKQFTCLVQEEK